MPADIGLDMVFVAEDGAVAGGEIDGIPVPVVSKADLIFAKKEANRPKDRIDLEELQS